jgi:hypothetical protein
MCFPLQDFVFNNDENDDDDDDNNNNHDTTRVRIAPCLPSEARSPFRTRDSR